MTAPVPDLGVALLAALDEHTIARLAERLRPHLTTSTSSRELLTPTEAANRLRLHPKTVVRMARDGRLPAIKVGTGWRFHADQLAIEPRTAPQTPRAGRTRPRARVGGVPASVHAIRGDNAERGKGT
jgi:excisionase family DNA binding protein